MTETQQRIMNPTVYVYGDDTIVYNEDEELSKAIEKICQMNNGVILSGIPQFKQMFIGPLGKKHHLSLIYTLNGTFFVYSDKNLIKDSIGLLSKEDQQTLIFNLDLFV